MTKEGVTNYFEGEGRPFMHDCIHRAVDWSINDGVDTIVMFTGTGDGPHYVAKELLPRQRYSHLHVVAVTPPVGRPYRQNPGDHSSPLVRSGINPAMREELAALGITVVSAHLPFKEMHNGRERTSEWARVAEAYGVLGGGFSLCIQAVLVACDAGAVQHGDRVVVLSADTAFAATACRTESFLSPSEGLLVGHIICRPIVYSISKRLHETVAKREPSAQLALPTSTAVPPAGIAPQPPRLSSDTMVSNAEGAAKQASSQVALTPRHEGKRKPRKSS